MLSYSIYGVTFRSPLSFLSPLPAATTPPTLAVLEQEGTLSLAGSPLLTALAEEQWYIAAPTHIYRHPEGDLLLFPGGDQIRIQPTTITYHHAGQHPPRADLMDVRLLGSAFAWWLLSQGRVPFHAGALLVEGEALLITADSGMGKSSLLCSLLARGIPLLADDFASVHLAPDGTPLASSAYPQMRLWPPTVEQFVGEAAPWPPVFRGGTKRRVRVGEGWGQFLAGSYPLNRIYQLERRAERAGPIRLERLGGHSAFMQALASITLAAFFPLADLPDVWSVVQQVADRVPFYRLSYPSGWQWLPAVQAALLDPTACLAQSPPAP